MINTREYEVGGMLFDLKTGKTEKIVNVTSNSVEVTRSKLTDRGISCTNWFNINDKLFKETFKKTTA